MRQCNISEWVASEKNQNIHTFKEAIHTILLAIGKSSDLAPNMLMKGGILLAIRYKSTRHTTDLDFSTKTRYQDFDVKNFLNRLDEQLTIAVEFLEYGLDCRVQTHHLNPPDATATFPTLKVKVGYAYKSNPNAHKNLLAGKASTVVELDYSFNEPAPQPEFLSIGDGASVCAYMFQDLVAEKYRALLQQPTRRRSRRQDVFDLYLLLDGVGIMDPGEKQMILNSLLTSANSRRLKVSKDSVRQPIIKDMAGQEYDLLRAEIEVELPDFDMAFQAICEFYESLPW